MFTRRRLLAASGATIASVGFGFGSPSHRPAAASLNSMLGLFAEQLLEESPQKATELGLDSDKRENLKAKLDDCSWSAIERSHARCARRVEALRSIDPTALRGADVVNYQVALYANEMGVEAGHFSYGDNTIVAINNQAVTPYVISQEGGAYSVVPDFLDTQHQVVNSADADAYLTRMEAFAACLDQQTERAQRDAGLGVIPPDFILDSTLAQIKGIRAVAPDQSSVVLSIAKKAAAAGLTGDYARRAQDIVKGKIYPSFERQIAVLTANRKQAQHDAGVWRLPEGDAYYAWALKVGTSTSLTANEAHELGVEQNKAIMSKMDGLLNEQGLTGGSVADRMTALSRDPRNLFPNSDAGRAQLIAYLNDRIAAARPLMPKLSRLDLKANVVVKRVPIEIETGQPLGYMNAGSIDGSRPSIYYINLHNNAYWPRFRLPTVTYHETIPGHVWQQSYVRESTQLPLFSKLLDCDAYVEGWALYSEQLADEIGLYDNDPIGRLGYLQLQQLRACRLVADTGLHSKRWSREQTLSFMTEMTGQGEDALGSEVDRYCAWPGQACGYKVGQIEILRLRTKAIGALGHRYDLRDFNDAVLTSGVVPLTILATVIDSYIARNRSTR